jgi:cell division septum initiation protein DivIVA
MAVNTEADIVRKSPFSNWSSSNEDVLGLIEELEDLVSNCRQVFGKALWVDIDEHDMLTNKIRASLPDEIRKARGLQNERGKIVASAQEEAIMIKEQAIVEANRIVEESRKIAESMIEASELKRMAGAQAQAIVNGAENDAREERRCADEYALDILGQLEGHMANVLGVLKKDSEKLRRRIGNAEAEALVTGQDRQTTRR